MPRVVCFYCALNKRREYAGLVQFPHDHAHMVAMVQRAAHAARLARELRLGLAPERAP